MGVRYASSARLLWLDHDGRTPLTPGQTAGLHWRDRLRRVLICGKNGALQEEQVVKWIGEAIRL